MHYLLLPFLLLCVSQTYTLPIENMENQIMPVNEEDTVATILDEVSMYEPPKINFVEISVSGALKMGGGAVLTCKSYGAPPPVLSWFKNGVPIQQGSDNVERNDVEKIVNVGRKTVQEGGTSGQLVIECIDEDDQAEYTCQADNGHTTKSATKFITVQQSNRLAVCKRSLVGSVPVIDQWTHMRLEVDDVAVQMYCRAHSPHLVKITWFRVDDVGEHLIDDQLDHRFKVLSNGDLLIKQDGKWDSMADYMCVASNKFGSATRSGFLYPTDGY